MSYIFDKESNGLNYDWDLLRNDLINEYGAQCIAFSGRVGFLDMLDVETATNEKLVEMAQIEGLCLEKYRKI